MKENLSNYQACVDFNFEVAFPDPQKRMVDGSKVQEHYALIPTKQTATLEKLFEKERNIYEEIMLTTLAMFAADYEFEEAQVEINVNGEYCGQKEPAVRSLGPPFADDKASKCGGGSQPLEKK